MNVRRRRAAHALVVLGLWGTSSGAEAAVPLSLGARAPEPEAPPAEEDGFAFEDESEEAPPEEGEGDDDGFAVEDESDESAEDEGTVVMPAAPPEDDGPVMDVEGDDGEWTFEIEDVSEDEGAIEEEVKASTVQAEGQVGTVSGRVLDSVSGDPIIGGVVEVIGKKYKTKTDAAGEFSLDLPPGIYEIRLRSDSSQPRPGQRQMCRDRCPESSCSFDCFRQASRHGSIRGPITSCRSSRRTGRVGRRRTAIVRRVARCCWRCCSAASARTRRRPAM